MPYRAYTPDKAYKEGASYEHLRVYQQAVVLYDLTVEFCRQYLNDSGRGMPTRRTIDQMVQAARSGKQNIVEGSLGKSLKSNIKLTSVARASFGELLEDYRDFLRTHNLPLWEKHDPRVLRMRARKDHILPANIPQMLRWADTPEKFSNLCVTLLSMETYLLDHLIASLEKKFIQEGGYTENLFRKRLAEKRT
ncbi:MAG: four helix bundle suffix domain-containing protein [bacterium]|nr:four helix bundle suffix domain-containing protein [bacterium]